MIKKDSTKDDPKTEEIYFLKRRVEALKGLMNDQFYSMIRFCLTLPFGGKTLMEQMLKEVAEIHTEASIKSSLFLDSHTALPMNISPQEALEFVLAIHAKEKIMEEDWCRIENEGETFTVHYSKENCFYSQHCEVLVCDGLECACVRKFFYEGIIKGLTGKDYKSTLLTPELDQSFCSFRMEKRAESGDEKETVRDNIAFTVEENVKLKDAVKERTLQLELQNKNLKELKERAELANKAKSDFLANMSHELRTPLTSIIGFSQTVNDDLKEFSRMTQKDADHALKCNRIVFDQGQKLLALINDIIDLTIVESDRFEIEEKVVSAHDLIFSVITSFDLQARKKKITLMDNRAEQEYFQFLGDCQRIEQVLRNLLDNAIKFTEKGTIKISAFPKNERIYFKVRDEGVGMTEEQTKMIFNRFHQLDASSTRNFGGLGLGLDLVDKLVEKMGGIISVESKIGQGTTFTLEFPWKRPHAKNFIKTTPDERSQKIVNKNILLVEDDENVLFLLKSLFPDNELVIAKTGAEALEIIQGRNDFDLIFLDRLMPVMDGDQFMKELVSLYPKWNVPIIMLTAAAMKEKVESGKKLAKELGLEFKYVTKPFTKESIESALEKLN